MLSSFSWYLRWVAWILKLNEKNRKFDFLTKLTEKVTQSVGYYFSYFCYLHTAKEDFYDQEIFQNVLWSIVSAGQQCWAKYMLIL